MSFQTQVTARSIVEDVITYCQVRLAELSANDHVEMNQKNFLNFLDEELDEEKEVMR